MLGFLSIFDALRTVYQYIGTTFSPLLRLQIQGCSSTTGIVCSILGGDHLEKRWRQGFCQRIILRGPIIALYCHFYLCRIQAMHYKNIT